MSSIVGFCIDLGLDDAAQERKDRALSNALRHFPWLASRRVTVGASFLQLWGHGRLEELVVNLADGGCAAVVGPHDGGVSVGSVVKALGRDADLSDFELPWEGRAVLLMLSPDGRQWTMWNDWCGSIPVFHTQVGHGRIASTLEPAVVAAANYTSDDFFLPGLVSLLVNGHYLGDWTLYEGMRVLPAECMAEWDDDGYRWSRLWTVKPSDERWDRGWDDLAGEMYELSRQAIGVVLTTQPAWVLPLSGGLDSRLIAAVGSDMGVELHAYTYGPSGWNETICSRQVAKALDLPWERVDLGTDYLAKYTPMWADWFGSGLHFHGMYQLPFLEVCCS